MTATAVTTEASTTAERALGSRLRRQVHTSSGRRRRVHVRRFGIAIGLVIALVAVGCTPSPGPIFVLDDFNTGTVDLTGSGSGSVRAFVPDGTRYLALLDDPGASVPSTMTLNPGDGYLDIAAGSTPIGYAVLYGGFFESMTTELDLDATANGADRFRLTLDEAGTGGSVVVNACTSGPAVPSGCEGSALSTSPTG